MKNITQYSDNPNPEAQIGFLCYRPLNFYVYKNIYKYLPNSEFIIGDAYNAIEYFLEGRFAEERRKNVDTLIRLCQEQNIRWRYIDINSPDKGIFYKKYKILVSTWYTEAFDASYNQDKKFVRAMYGHAKDPWNYGLWSAYFDLILSYGPYSHERLSFCGTSVIVGNPKFDGWFSMTEQRRDTLKSLGLDETKKTVLYLPTYGVLSSIDIMGIPLSELKDFNVILKFHRNTAPESREQIELCLQRAQCRYVVQDDRDDILHSLRASDVVISDNSGAIFDAVLADIPIVLIDFLDEKTLGNSKNSLYFEKNFGTEVGFEGVVTDEKSIEQMIKKPGHEIGPVIRVSSRGERISEGLLSSAIKEAIEKDDFYGERRRVIRDAAFSYADGTAGKRAADEIMKLLDAPQNRRHDFIVALGHHAEFLAMLRGALLLQSAGKRYSRIRSLKFLEKIRTIIQEFF